MAVNKDNLTDEQVQKLIQSVQSAEQVVQEAKQTVQGAQQDKNLFYENKAEEIHAGEVLRKAMVENSEIFFYNKKLLAAAELKEKELQLAEREAKLRHQTKLDSIELSEKENNALIKHLANSLTIDFRTAAYHPISPNDQDKDSKTSK